MALAKLRAPGELEEEFQETSSAAADLKLHRGIGALQAPEVREELFLGAPHMSTGLHNRMVAVQKKTCCPVIVTRPGLLCQIMALHHVHRPFTSFWGLFPAMTFNHQIFIYIFLISFIFRTSLGVSFAGIGLQILQQACGINTVCPAQLAV